MKFNLSLVTMFLLVSTLGGCTLSPQTVTITPRIDVQSHPIGRGRTLALEVVDQRPTRHFGYRGGVYETAVISPQTDVAQTIRQAIAERLRASQFVVTTLQSDAPLSMRVGIQRIDYVATGEPMITEVRVRAAIRLTIRNQERVLTSQYQANSARRVLGPPSESANEAFINEVIAQALQRMFQDGAVIDLLAA